MSRPVALNNIEHRDLRVDTGHGATLGDDVMFVPTVPDEFRDVQAHYPIVFHKDAQGVLQPVALFGFRRGENLFLDGVRWDATYIPLAVRRQPFLIGSSGDQVGVMIDLEHPRVRRDGGEALFREHGGTTEYMDRMTSILRSLHDGLHRSSALVDALLRHGLLESFALDVELDSGAQHRLVGFYAIHEENLRALGDEALLELRRAGHLEPVYMALASLANLRVLIQRMNCRVAGQ